MDDFIIVDNTLIRYNGNQETVTIPDGVRKIVKSSFVSNKTIKCVVIPESVKRIESEAFCRCKGLTSVVISGSKKVFKHYAFYDCVNLKDVYFTGTLEEWMQLDLSARASSPLANGANLHINGKLLTNLVFPPQISTVTSVFYGCTSLKSVTIPETVKVIQDLAFFKCKSLQRVEIAGNVSVIEGGTFGDCYSLQAVALSEGLQEIRRSAFKGCPSLKAIEIPNSIEFINIEAFDNTIIVKGSKKNRVAKRYARKKHLPYEKI